MTASLSKGRWKNIWFRVGESDLIVTFNNSYVTYQTPVETLGKKGRMSHHFIYITLLVLVWGSLNQLPSFRYFPFFYHLNHWSAIEYHFHIWQLPPPQLNCGYPSNVRVIHRIDQLCKIKTFLNGELNKRIFSDPHPWSNNETQTLSSVQISMKLSKCGGISQDHFSNFNIL